jgi:hypothetical protein
MNGELVLDRDRRQKAPIERPAEDGRRHCRDRVGVRQCFESESE